MTFADPENLEDNFCSFDYLGWIFEHLPMVGGYIGFTFSAIEHKSINRGIGRWAELHMGWKTGTTNTDNTGVVYFGQQFRAGQMVPVDPLILNRFRFFIHLNGNRRA